MRCPGSVRLSSGLPGTSSPAAAAGILAHDIAARWLLDPELHPERSLGATYVIDGHAVVFDQEMLDGVQFYVDEINSTRAKRDDEQVEVDLTPALRKIDPDLGGTADFVRWRAKEKKLYAYDFKYGAGHLVRAEGNKQLLLYALGALLALGKPAAEITVKIVQPRIDHEDGRVREWTFKASDLLDFAADVADSAMRSRDSNAALAPGAEQCQWCPAKRICPELEKQQHALVAAEFNEVTTYDPAALAAALDAIPLVEARIKALREFAYQEAERGRAPPGYKLVAKRGTRKWVDEKAVADWATARAIDPYEEPSIKSPAQMEKGLTKAQKQELADMTVTVSSGHVLAPESDRRPAVHLALASEFAVIPGPRSNDEANPRVFTGE
jgi:hypothetical protein